MTVGNHVVCITLAIAPTHCLGVIYRLGKRQPTLCRGYNSSEIMPKYIWLRSCFSDRIGDKDASAHTPEFCTFSIEEIPKQLF
jgi:hypothetical protein